MRRIIDFHTHIGDIFETQKNISFKTNLKKMEYDDPFIACEKSGYTQPLIPSTQEEMDQLSRAGLYRCQAWSLENMGKEMDAAGISYAVALPVCPNNTFEEYLAASKLDHRIIPFTSIDYSMSTEKIVEKLEQDIKRGAKGLKIHPVLQKVKLGDERTEAAVQVFQKAELPVLVHVGACSYYPSDMPYHDTPEYASLDEFFNFVHRFPECSIIAAHCCTIIDLFAPEVKDLKKVYTDTTMCSAELMRKGVEQMGEDHILFGTDVPFGRFQPSVEQMEIAFGQEERIAQKVFFENAYKLLRL